MIAKHIVIYPSCTIWPLQVHSINFQGRGLLQLIDKALRCNQCFCLLMGHEIRWKASVTSASILRVLGNVTTLLEHCRVTGPTPPVLQVHVAKTAGSWLAVWGYMVRRRILHHSYRFLHFAVQYPERNIGSITWTVSEKCLENDSGRCSCQLVNDIRYLVSSSSSFMLHFWFVLAIIRSLKILEGQDIIVVSAFGT